MTYGEFITMVDGYHRRRLRKYNDMLFLAWHVEALARTNKLPELASILRDENNEPSKPKTMTDEQMLAKIKLLNALYGGDVVEV